MAVWHISTRIVHRGSFKEQECSADWASRAGWICCFWLIFLVFFFLLKLVFRQQIAPQNRKDWINTLVIYSAICFENNDKKTILFIPIWNKFSIGQSIKGSSEGSQSKIFLGKCVFFSSLIWHLFLFLSFILLPPACRARLAQSVEHDALKSQGRGFAPQFFRRTICL